VALQLLNLGLSDVKVLRGGYNGWVGAGGAVAMGDGAQ
jgi:rhodanese-related sulfurtransferase